MDWENSFAGRQLAAQGFATLVEETQRAYPWLMPEHAQRLCRHYGTKASEILQGATRYKSGGRHFGANLTEAEIHYLTRQEWAERADDVIWRRTKLGLRKLSLRLRPEEIAAIDAFIRGQS